MTTRPNKGDRRCKVIRDRFVPGAWRVEKMNEDGGYAAVAIFHGPSARECTIQYARRRFGEFDEI